MAGEDIDIYGPTTPLADGELLTLNEITLINKLSEVASGFARVYEQDVLREDSRATTHSNDMAEVVTHIHDLQARVLSRAAARAYPGRYRLL